MKKYISKAFLILVLILITFLLTNNKDNKDSLSTSFLIKDSKVYITTSWFEYEPIDEFSNFSIKLPKEISIEGRTLNKDTKKVGEFSPGLIKLKGGQSCFDKEWFSETGASELISLKEININNLKGKLMLEKAEAWDGVNNDQYWYPHVYCLQKENSAFVITFYEWSLDEKKINEHKKILESIEF